MSTIDITNRSAFLYINSVMPQIKKISEPLTKYLNIDFFGYIKILKDCSYITLLDGNHSNYIEYYLKHVPDQGKYFSQFIKESPKNEYKYTYMPKYPGNDIILKAVYEHGFWHGLVIGRKTDNYYEDFTFLFKRTARSKADFLVQNLDLLHQFMCYFKIAAKDLIDHSDKSKLATYKNKFDLNLEGKLVGSLNERQKFLSEIAIHNPNGIKLSNQQQRCVELLAQGKTMKETGCILGISPRTVESYIENIKDKTGLHYKSQIIDLFDRMSCLGLRGNGYDNY